MAEYIGFLTMFSISVVDEGVSSPVDFCRIHSFWLIGLSAWGTAEINIAKSKEQRA